MIEKYAKNALNWKKKLKFIYKIKKNYYSTILNTI